MSNDHSYANYCSDANYYSSANYHSDINYGSYANYQSNANYHSDANYYSDANYCSFANFYSDGNFHSDGNYYSFANFFSDGNYESAGNYYCKANYHSNGNYKCYAMHRTMFCYRQKGKSDMIFNKQLTENEYDDIIDKIKIDFKKVRWTNAQDILKKIDGEKNIYLTQGLRPENDEDSLQEAWKPVLDQLKKLTELEIWDDEANEVVRKITGYDLNSLKENKMIKLSNGKEVSEETVIEALKGLIE